jgi:hypothetical protein
MLEVGDAQPVLECLERVAVGDATGVAVREEEAEPDRQLANQVERPMRKNARSSCRGGTGHEGPS